MRLALLWLCLLLGCGSSTEPRAKPVIAVDATPPKQLRIGSAPYLSPEELQEIFNPLLQYITKKTGVQTSLVLAKDYKDLSRLLEESQIEIAIFPPYPYVEARARMKTLVPLLSPITAGAETSGSYLFTSSKSGIKSLDGLKGKTIAFVDPASTTGYFFPMVALLDAGLKPRQDLRITFLGSHDKVLNAVRNQEVDAGASYSSAMDSYVMREKLDSGEFVILAKGPRSPHEVWAHAGALSSGFGEELRQLLFSLSTSTPEGRQVLTLFNGFVPVDEKNYEEIREISQRVKSEFGE
jgi:phosphonate transport system substrate-binding protein